MQSVLAKLSLCRTRALGGQTFQCDDCGEVTEKHHSCSDRHCPQCSGCKRYDFADRAERLILDDVIYYQVVFTLPGDLSEMALANRESMADLLFNSAAKALHKTVRTQQGYDPASMMVLHTWNQQLQSHWHVHALVPGGGPSLTGDHWKSAEAPPAARNSDGFYLVDAISLRESFRKAAIAQLKRLYKHGELKLGGKFAYLQEAEAWDGFCKGLGEMEWVSFIQPPPTKSSTAEQVVRYLTRYLTGGPISDSRIIAADEDHVTFLAREGKRMGGEREQVPVTLDTLEFMRRWCEHIQPDQLTKTRYFGGWCSRKRTRYQTRCRDLLGQSQQSRCKPAGETTESTESATASASLGDSAAKCPACESGSLRLIGSVAKPTWATLLTHLDTRCPSWYADHDYKAFCEHLEDEYGIGYEDWCLEMRIESPMRESGSGKGDPPHHLNQSYQLYLPGLSPEGSFAIESY